MRIFAYCLLAALSLACTKKSSFAGGTKEATTTADDTVFSGDEEAATSEDTVTEEGEVLSAVKIGVNFEDQLGSDVDNDYNDAVLCFTGNFDFAVGSTTITSTDDQIVTATTLSSSDCKHNITTIVVHEDGTKSTSAPFSSKSGSVKLNFVTGDKLEVYMQPTSGCDTSLKRDMHNSKYAKIEVNVCRTGK